MKWETPKYLYCLVLLLFFSPSVRCEEFIGVIEGTVCNGVTFMPSVKEPEKYYTCLPYDKKKLLAKINGKLISMDIVQEHGEQGKDKVFTGLYKKGKIELSLEYSETENEVSDFGQVLVGTMIVKNGNQSQMLNVSGLRYQFCEAE